jgi:predicted TIM-barrel enzyme
MDVIEKGRSFHSVHHQSNIHVDNMVCNYIQIPFNKEKNEQVAHDICSQIMASVYYQIKIPVCIHLRFHVFNAVTGKLN